MVEDALGLLPKLQQRLPGNMDMPGVQVSRHLAPEQEDPHGA